MALLFSGCSPKIEKEPGKIESAKLVAVPNAELSIQDAAVALQKNQLDAAEKILRTRLIQQPNDFSASVLMSQLLTERRQFSAAIEMLDRLALSHPEQRDVCAAEAGEVAFTAGDAKSAIDRFDALVQRSPTFVSARRRLAEILNSQGFRFDANEALRAVAVDQPLSLRELAALINPMRPYSTFAEKPNIADARQLAIYGTLGVVSALRSRRDTGEAIECLSASELLRSGDPAATAMMGLLWAETNQFDPLRRWAGGVASNQSERLNRYPAYWMAMGSLAMHDRDDSASACFAEAIRREPGCAEAWNGLVAALELEGKNRASDVARGTSLLVEESIWLTQQLSADQLGNVEMLQRLVEVLNKLGRLIEAVAWQEMWLMNSSPQSPQLQTLSDYKRKLVNRYPSGFKPSAIVGGLIAKDFTAVDPWLAKLAASSSGKIDSPLEPPFESMTGPKHAAWSSIDYEHPVFVGVAQALGLDFRHLNAATPVQKEFRLFEPLGGGVACLDYDLDGEVDLYFCQAASDPLVGIGKLSNRMFRQIDERFLDQTVPSKTADHHYSMGVTAGDLNQDGFADLVIGNIGINVCLINQGDGTFRSCDMQDPVWQQPMLTTSVAIADLTGDGLPDIAEVNYVDDARVFDPISRDAQGKALRLPGPLHFTAAPQRVFVSQGNVSQGNVSQGNVSLGNGQWRGQSLPSNDEIERSTGMGVLVTDLDSDGRNELFIANDQNANQVWKFGPTTQHSQTQRSSGAQRKFGPQLAFSDLAVTMGLAYGPGGKPTACMGIAAADFDHNGRLDLHVTNFVDEWSNHYMQNNAGAFIDASVTMGISDLSLRMLGFGTQAIDFDNNATWDIFVGNGHIEDFRNRGKDFEMLAQLLTPVDQKYLSVVPEGDDDYWKATRLARAVAKCDWNRDGRTDLITTVVNGPVELLENRTTTQNHFLQIELVGTVSERDAIGAKVVVVAGDQTWTQFCQTGDGYMCKNESLISFGLGSQGKVDRVEVTWPGGNVQTFVDPPTDARIVLVESNEKLWRR